MTPINEHPVVINEHPVVINEHPVVINEHPVVITPNFTIEELYASATANRLGIDNTPDIASEKKLIMLAERILQPLRDKWGAPIIVTSGYRSKKLNSAVGGAASSQHLYGEAADIKAGNAKQNRQLFYLAMNMMEKGEIEVGQLIDEYNYTWIHISLPRKNKKNSMILHIG